MQRLVYVVQAKKEYFDGNPVISTNLGGIHSKGAFYVCRYYSNVMDLLQVYREDTYQNGITINDIESIYIVPYCFTNFRIDPSLLDDEDGWFLQIGVIFGEMSRPNQFEKTINKPTTIDGYTPKNKKLLTREFNYLLVSNQSGATEELAYELFKTNNCTFRISGIPVITGSGMILPEKYEHRFSQGDIGYYDDLYSLPSGKFAVTDQYYDTYRYWLQLNSFNITSGAIESGIQSTIGALGLASGNLSNLGRATGILDYALNLQREIYMKKRTPPSSISQSANGNITSAMQENGFVFYQMSIKREFAEIIDNFFSMFGYKVNVTKVPNITGRQNWNFVKLINPNIEGTEIPEFELNEYKKQLEAGITFWHNPLTFRDYSQSNSIVS